jgi:hypothetical protein
MSFKIDARFDSATPHRLGDTDKYLQCHQFRNAPQPPYNQDISLYDLFLFGDPKTKLEGEEFDTLEELQRKVQEPLGEITQEPMQPVYEHWIVRLNQVISANVDYVER